MKLTLICIKRPVFASVLSLLLIVFGWIGFLHLDLRYFPDIPQKFAQVSVHYSGASPSLMQNSVTRYLENALINIRGIKQLSSNSTYNNSYIYLQFNPDVNMVEEMGLVREAVSAQQANLPADADPPSITSGGVSDPALNIGFMDDELTPAQIRNYLTEAISPKLNNLPGVGAIWVYGASTYAMRIWLAPEKMAALGVTINDIQTALKANNIDFSAGSIRSADRNFSLVSDTRLTSVDEFKNLIIRDTHDQIIHLSDVATIELGSQSLEDSPMRINGKNAIDMEVRPLVSANPIKVAQEVKAALLNIQKTLPHGMTLVVTYDQSLFLKKAINESWSTLLESIALVVLVVLFFLGSLRAAFVPIITIPVCLVSVFGVMMLCDFSINVMTLLAIILAIGLVVDDAIVMLENIHRHIEMGEEPMKAAIRGSKEIGFSIIAMTITLAAVYAPTGFVSGFTATVFREFAFTLAGAVLISGFVALTLSPMMCARLLTHEDKVSPYQLFLNKIFEKINEHYRQFLSFCLTKKTWIIGLIVLLGLSGYGLYQILPQTFIPKEDLGYFTTSIQGPQGSSISYTNRYMTELDKIYANTPEILSYASFINAGSGVNFVTLIPFNHRDLSTQEVIDKIRPLMNAVPGITVIPNIPDPVRYSQETTGNDVQFQVITLGSYESLEKTIQKIEKALRADPVLGKALSNINTNLKFNNQVYEVSFNRERAAAYNVSLQDVAAAVSTLMSGSHTTDVFAGNQSYPVLLQMNMTDLQSFMGLNRIYVRSSVGAMVPLSNLIYLSPNTRQNSMTRFDRMNAATVSADMIPGMGAKEVISRVQSLLKPILEPTEGFAFTGRLEAFMESSGILIGLFLMSLVFIYLVLAAQFESFIDPFIILLSVPLSIIGAIGTLKVTGGSINLYTEIGLITLVGLISKHGILITQFANVRFFEHRESLLDAVVNAAVIRLRPIAMTSLAMLLGSLPLVFASGPGSISHNQIGWTLVGGLFFGSFFSLIVVPVAYVILSRFDFAKREELLVREQKSSSKKHVI
jgi:multidrug efflux pump